MNDLLIQAAAELSGRPADSITIPEALQILYDDGENRGALYNQIEARAAATFFDDPARVQQWTFETDDEMMKDPLMLQALVRRDLGKEIRKNGRLLLRARQAIKQGEPYTEEQQQNITQAGLIFTGEQLPIDAAANALQEIRPEDLEELFLPVKVELPPELRESLQRIYKSIGSTMASIHGVSEQLGFKAESISNIVTSFAGYQKTIEKLREVARQFLESPTGRLYAEITGDLEPYLEDELKNPKYDGATIADLFDSAERDDDDQILESSLLMQAVIAARAAKEKAEATPTATVKRADSVEYPLDKPNSIIWNLLEENTAGQIAFNMAKYGSRQTIPAYYSIDFDDLGNDITITKRLLPFDKRVYVAVSALFNAGNTVITLSQIYKTMGNTGRPNTRDLTKINDAITKMSSARIMFDNEQEAAKYKYARFKYDGQLLPLERGTVIVNGQLADAAIHIFREPPLITFAKQRKQITTLDVKLLQSPISKTDANLQIDDYLIERISKGKNGKSHSCRILLKTLYDHTGIKTKKQQQRAPGKIKTYLEHYTREAFIKRFTMEKDGITIYW